MESSEQRENLATVLVRMKAAENLETAYTLVDEGKADGLIKTFRLNLLDSMLDMYKDKGVDLDEKLTEEFDALRAEVEDGEVTMEKYAVPDELANQLLMFGVCNTQEEALEKVASGEAPLLLKKVQLAALTQMGDSVGGPGVASDMANLEKEIAELEDAFNKEG